MSYVGVTNWDAHINTHVRPGAQSKEKPLLGYRKNPSSQRERPITKSGTPGHSMEQKKY